MQQHLYKRHTHHLDILFHNIYFYISVLTHIVPLYRSYPWYTDILQQLLFDKRSGPMVSNCEISDLVFCICQSTVLRRKHDSRRCFVVTGMGHIHSDWLRWEDNVPFRRLWPPPKIWSALWRMDPLQVLFPALPAKALRSSCRHIRIELGWYESYSKVYWCAVCRSICICADPWIVIQLSV